MYFSDIKKQLIPLLLNSNSKNYLESKATLSKIISDYIDYKNFKGRFLVSFNNLRYTYVIINKDYINSKNGILNTYFLMETFDSLLKLSDCTKIYRKFDKIFLKIVMLIIISSLIMKIFQKMEHLYQEEQN